MQRVVITGVGVVTPIGLNAPDFWRNLTNGVSGAGPITAFDATGFDVRIAAEVKGFDPRNYMDFKEARRTHRSAHFALAATREALADAGLTIDAQNRDNVGVVINTGGGGIGEVEQGAYVMKQKGPGRVSPFVVPNSMANAPACHVSIQTGARGPLITSTSACASGNQALIEGKHILQRGEAEVIIAGGVESIVTPIAIAGFGNAGALSKRNDEPARASRPFDRDRDGFVFGEGGAVLILETEEHAQRRGARIYGEVLGGALTSDAYHITAPDPEGDGARRAMRKALQSARLQPQDLDVIFAHGTSTPLNDVAESQSIEAVLGEAAHHVAISGTKSMVGHLLGAAGAVSAVAAVLAIRDSLVPPTINLENPDPKCVLDYVPNQARQMPVRTAMINAFGFGGQNVVLMLGKYDGPVGTSQ
ncbi:MAG: beta-ketoacyl-ACP synthase II [Anaerolineae bacterium]